MKAVAGVVGLLVALAIVGLMTVRQLKAVGHGGAVTSASAPEGVAVPRLSGSGSMGDQTRQLEKQVVTDITKAIDQGAARNADADKP